MSAEPLVVPIGQSGGPTGPAGDPAAGHLVRVGDRPVRLARNTFVTWRRAHGTTGRRPYERPTRDALVAALTGNGRPASAVEADIAELLSAGLLDQVDPGDGAAFARRYRMTPLLLNLGNSAADPARYELGRFDGPVMLVPRWLCTVWEWCDRSPDLWSAAAVLASAEGAEVAQLLPYLLESLHRLLAADAAYLDLAGPGEEGP
jgi:hypothetical protein